LKLPGLGLPVIEDKDYLHRPEEVISQDSIIQAMELAMSSANTPPTDVTRGPSRSPRVRLGASLDQGRAGQFLQSLEPRRAEFHEEDI